MAMNPRRSIESDLKELRAMRRHSEERQGRDTKSEVGQKAMKASGTSQNFQGGGYTPKSKPDGSKYQGAPISKANLQEYKDAQQKQTDYKKPPRRATGREAMIAERYMNQEQKKKNNESSVVG